jgi:hypothetical protein
MNSDVSPQGPSPRPTRFSADVVRIVGEVFGSAGKTVLEALSKPVRNVKMSFALIVTFPALRASPSSDTTVASSPTRTDPQFKIPGA